MEIKYDAEPTPAKFHSDDSFYRCMRGPVRSGKSTCMSIEIMKRACEQKSGPDGFRRTKAVVIRNTYRELEDTTLRTWLMWFPESIFGLVNKRTMIHTIQFNDVFLEVLFRALDRPDDVNKLLSLEASFAWINEAREIPKAIVDVVGDRVEQYPALKDGGCTWGGVFMDTKSPDEDHWWHDLEASPPKVVLDSGKEVQWTFFIQPGALKEVDGRFLANPRAENIKNLNSGHDYYLKRLMGKKKSYVRVYYCNQFGYVEEGKRVHPEYADATHCAPSPLLPDVRHPVIVGLDFGLTPAAAFFSHRPNGQWWLFHEIATERIGIKHFGEMLLLPYMLANLMDYEVTLYGDPYGNASPLSETETPLKILSALGFNIQLPSVDGGPTIRRESLSAPLERLIDGQPGLLIDPSCRVIRKGLSSKYIYKRIQVIGDDKFHDKPDKNFWSHICEAAQHGMVGAGEGKRITQRPIKRKKGARLVTPSQGQWMAA